jgi:hypothetical protein
MAATESRTLVLRVIDEIWNRGNLDLADALFSPGYVNHGGLIPDLIRGPEAIKFAVALYQRAFPNLQLGVDTLIADTDRVTFNWSAQDIPEIPAPRRQSRIIGRMIVHVSEDQISESWISWDAKEGARRSLQMFTLDSTLLDGLLPGTNRINV